MRVFTTVLTAFVLSIKPVSAALQDSTGVALRRTTLSNGLEVVVVENHAAPLATVLLGVRAGSFAQDETQRGLAHVCEHLLFQAYGGAPTDFGSDASDLDAYYNGGTGHEVARYALVLPSDNTEKGVRLLARLVRRVQIGADDLVEVKSVILDELERAQSDPEAELVREAARALWSDSWHRRDVEGDSLSLQSITTDMAVSHLERFYVPNNMALIVTGDVAYSEVLEAANDHFGDWARRPDPFEDIQAVPVPPISDTHAVVVTRNLRDVTIRVEMQGVDFGNDPDATFAADVLSTIMNNPGSEFQTQLVGDGLFESIFMSHSTMSEVGQITVVGKTTVAGAGDALVALLAQLDSLDQLVGVTDTHLSIAKKRREVGAALAREEIATLAPNLAFWWAGTGLDYYVDYSVEANAQTLNDLRQFANRYVVHRPRVIGVLGPSTATVRIAQWLGN